jgi:GntR family transcriptional regulator
MNDSQPQYRQIERSLRERIASLPPGERVPSDAELCAEFGVSRMTARNAMQRLAEDGLITREPGRGSFVATPHPFRRTNRLMTFSQEMRRQGRVPSSRVLERAVGPATPIEAANLGLVAGDPVVRVRRLRQADGQPMAIESATLLGASAEAVMAADLGVGSLHDALSRAGFGLHRGTGTISAAAATADEAAVLGIRTGDPLLVERRVISDRHGRKIESTESRYPADRYGLVVRFDVESRSGSEPEGPGDPVR